jgi:hypothetical protein
MEKENQPIYPKNKKHFLNLIKFYQKLAPILKKSKANPIATGSLAYFLHTKDANTKVNDFDFLIPREKFPAFIAGLAASKVKSKYLSDWESIETESGNSKIDFDSFERYYKGKDRDFCKINLSGAKISYAGIDALIIAYKFASKVSNDKPKEHKNKFERLTLLKNSKK